MRCFIWFEDQNSVSALVLTIDKTDPDIMTDSSSWAFTGCMDEVDFHVLLISQECLKHQP